MKIYAIVVTYNGKTWIDRCFGSLVASSIPLSILVIDNGSSDGTPEIIRRSYPQVEVIKTGTNLGFGKGNNIGLLRVLEEKADYAFLLNQDAWIEKDTLKKLISVHVEHPHFGLLSPVPYDGEDQELDYLYSKYYKQGILDSIEYSNKTYEINFINAAGWLLTNALISKVGGFHPDFMMHGEDKNYIDRIHKQNDFKIGITLSAKYFHDRKDRQLKEHTQKKRLYAWQSKIKSDFYNPNKKSLLTLINLWIYQSALLVKREVPLKTYIRSIIQSGILFCSAIGKRKIYFKP